MFRFMFRITTANMSEQVTWDGPDDPTNPINWSLSLKLMITSLMSFFTLITITSSLMIAPVLSEISTDLGTTDESETQLALSIYVLGYASGPLIFAPLSEIYGRRQILLMSNVFYILWNTVAGFAKTEGLLIAARFLSGVGASASFGVSPSLPKVSFY